MSLKVRTGDLDRRIIIQSVAEAVDAYGDPIQTWSAVITVWAERTDIGGRERFGANQVLAHQTTRFRIRWRSGVDEKMRIVDGDTTFDIVGKAGDRRTGWLELTCEAINPAATDT